MLQKKKLITVGVPLAVVLLSGLAVLVVVLVRRNDARKQEEDPKEFGGRISPRSDHAKPAWDLAAEIIGTEPFGDVAKLVDLVESLQRDGRIGRNDPEWGYTAADFVERATLDELSTFPCRLYALLEHGQRTTPQEAFDDLGATWRRGKRLYESLAHKPQQQPRLHSLLRYADFEAFCRKYVGALFESRMEPARVDKRAVLANFHYVLERLPGANNPYKRSVESVLANVVPLLEASCLRRLKALSDTFKALLAHKNVCEPAKQLQLIEGAAVDYTRFPESWCLSFDGVTGATSSERLDELKTCLREELEARLELAVCLAVASADPTEQAANFADVVRWKQAVFLPPPRSITNAALVHVFAELDASSDPATAFDVSLERARVFCQSPPTTV